MEDKGTRTTVWLTEDIREDLRMFAFKRRMTNSDVMRQALARLFESDVDIPYPSVGDLPTTIHICEYPGCKRIDTVLKEGEGYDPDGNLKAYEKWLCRIHKGK